MQSQASSHDLHIIIVTNAFPTLSETFIFRKVLWLAQAGYRITVVSHRIGDWSLFEDQPPLPHNVTVLTLPSRQEGWRVFFSQFVQQTARYPIRALMFSTKLFWKRGLKAGAKAIALNLPLLIQPATIIHFEYLGLAATYHATVSYASAATVLSCRGADLHLLDQTAEPKRSHYIVQLQRVDGVHCVTQELADEVTRLSQRRDAIYVNRPAVMTDSIPPKDLYSSSDCPRIISTGRLVWKKGFDYLLSACAQLRSEGLTFQVQILGGGVLEPGFRRAVHAMGLQDTVTFVGPVPPSDVLRRLQAADLFVLSSHEEGISNAVLEAMAVGLPVVTTNAGGMAEAVQDGINGFVTPVRQPWLLAERIKQLLQDATLRETMGRAARLRVDEAFSLTRQVKLFETMYVDIQQQPKT